MILPRRNAKDEPDIPERARAEVTLHFVSTIDEVVELALLPAPGREHAAE